MCKPRLVLLAAALLMEREDLQFDREVDLAHLDVLEEARTTGAKFRMLRTGGGRRSHTPCTASAGVAMTPMCASVATTDSSSAMGHTATSRREAEPLADGIG